MTRPRYQTPSLSVAPRGRRRKDDLLCVAIASVEVKFDFLEVIDAAAG